MVEEKELEVWLLTMNTLVRLASLVAFIGLARNHAGTINDFLQRHEITRLALLYRKGSTRAELLSWLQSHLPMHDLTLYGERTLWTNGSLLCTLVNIVVPEACLNPNCHQNETPKHGQILAYKYLGVQPEFTEDELNQIAFTSEQEKKLIKYLSQVKLAITSFLESVQNMKFCTDYIAKGMGLVSGEQNRKAIFFIYPIPKKYQLDDVLVVIKGPYGSYGQIIIPAINQNKFINTNYQRAIYLSSKVSSISPTLQGGVFLRKLSQNYGGGDDFDIKIKIKVTRTQAKISYIPKNSGIHEISLVTNNHHLIGSPFGVPIDDPSNKYISDDSLSDDEFDKIIIKKKYISGIVDVVGEKMLLNENGTLEKIKTKDLIDDCRYLNKSNENKCIKIEQLNKNENIKTDNNSKDVIIEDLSEIRDKVDNVLLDLKEELYAKSNSEKNEDKLENNNHVKPQYEYKDPNMSRIYSSKSKECSEENDLRESEKYLTKYKYLPETNNCDLLNVPKQIQSNEKLKKYKSSDFGSDLTSSRINLNRKNNMTYYQNEKCYQNDTSLLPENENKYDNLSKEKELKYKILEMTDDNLKIEVQEINKEKLDDSKIIENDKRLISDNSEKNLRHNRDEIIAKQNQYTECENNKDNKQLSVLKYFESDFDSTDNDFEKYRTVSNSNKMEKNTMDIYESPDILETSEKLTTIKNEDISDYNIRKIYSIQNSYNKPHDSENKYVDIFENKVSNISNATTETCDTFIHQEEPKSNNFKNNDPDLLQFHIKNKTKSKSFQLTSDCNNYPQNAKQYISLNKKLKKLGITYKYYDKKQRFLKSVLRNDLNKNFQQKEMSFQTINDKTNSQKGSNKQKKINRISSDKFEVFTKIQDNHSDKPNNYSPKTMKMKKSFIMNQNADSNEILARNAENSLQHSQKETLKKELENLNYLSLEKLVKTKKELFEKEKDDPESKTISARIKNEKTKIKSTCKNKTVLHISENNTFDQTVKEDFTTVLRTNPIILNRTNVNEKKLENTRITEIKQYSVAERVTILNKKIQETKISQSPTSLNKSNFLTVNNKTEEKRKEKVRNEIINIDNNHRSLQIKKNKEIDNETDKEMKIPTVAERILVLLNRESNYEKNENKQSYYLLKEDQNSKNQDITTTELNNEIFYRNKSKNYDDKTDMSLIDKSNHEPQYKENSKLLSINDRINTLFKRVNNPDSDSYKNVKSTLSNSPSKKQVFTEINQEFSTEKLTDIFEMSPILEENVKTYTPINRTDSYRTSISTFELHDACHVENVDTENIKIQSISERIKKLLKHDENISESANIIPPTQQEDLAPLPKCRVSLITQNKESKTTKSSTDPEVSKSQKIRFHEAKKYFEQLKENSSSNNIEFNDIKRSTSVPCMSTEKINQKLCKTNSINSINILEKCCVPNLYNDISGDSDFFGIPNKTAVVANLANLQQKNETNIDNSNLIPDFENEFPYFRKTDINNFKSKPDPPQKILMIQTEDDIYI